ncbi:MAG TPA: DUF4149 domain-containing protein [Sorangium sp.]|nr:DUF4149 domain-containing protein [Sorangium sp.]
MIPPRDEYPAPGEDTFCEDDLAPSEFERKALRARRIDRAATSIAVVALGLWSGGMLSLGACAAPMVFKLVPAPVSGYAMGAAFARFDNIAIGCGVVLLAAEMVRTWLARGHTNWLSRVRRYMAILLSGAAVYGALVLTPTINEMHASGVQRRVGPAGEQLERVHNNAEMIGRITVPSAMLLMALHIFTIRSAEDDEELALAPLAPGG